MRPTHRIAYIAATASLAFTLAPAMRVDAAEGYRFVLVSEISSDSERTRLLSMGGGSRAANIRGELSTDPAFLAGLRSRGLALHNVIGRQRAGNGRVIVYVR